MSWPLKYESGIDYYDPSVDIKNGDVVWESGAEFGLEGYVNGRIHFSPFISGADRLPNGNTMICSGVNGVIFEITREKEVVWHWVRPTPNMDGAVHWGIFRVHRYSPNYCPQFQGLPPAKGC